MKRRKPKKTTPLTSQVRMIRQETGQPPMPVPHGGRAPQAALDRQDSDLLAHVNTALQNWEDELSLPDFSLLTEEQAAEAVRVVDERMELLNRKLRTVQGLKRLLEVQKNSK